MRSNNQRIENTELGLHLIVFGYDDINQAHLFTIVDPGVSKCRDSDGLAVIGSGALLAHKSLLSAELPIISQAEMICRVAEAKFDAEHAPGVGRDSAIGGFRKPATTVQQISEAFISIPATETIRMAHAKRKDRPYPQKLLEALTDQINSEVTSEHMHRVFMKALQLIEKENKKRRARKAKS